MIHKVQAIVLQSHETGETSEVVKLFTAEFGRVGVMAKGSRRPKSRTAGALQPLNEVEVVMWLKPGAELGTLNEVSVLSPHEDLRADLLRLTLGCMVCEIGSQAAAVCQPAPELYGLVKLGLVALAPGGSQEAETLAAHLLVRLLGGAGYGPLIAPELLRGRAGGERPSHFVLDANTGLITDAAGPAPSWPSPPLLADGRFKLPPEAVRAIYENGRCVLEEILELPSLSAPHAAQLLEALVAMAERHLDHGVRSAGVWRQVRRVKSEG